MLVTLIAVAMAEPPAYRRAIDTPLKKVWRTLHKTELNREARERDMVAYYEGLLNEGARVSAMNDMVGRTRQIEIERWDGLGRRLRNDFLAWDYEPSFVNRDGEDPSRDLVVNSHGMADREYARAKPPNVWRIALLGDSVTRGQGVPMFGNYESLLEERLNAAVRPSGPPIEVLNFAVGGYRITQLVDVATSVVPAFDADVYVLPLTRLSVYRRWNDHVSALVQNGVDLKYDFLRQVVAESGFRPSDSRGTADAKLARFRFPVLEWAISSIRDQAHSQGARLVVVLLPNGTNPEDLQEEFAGIREIVRRAGVPILDLLDLFEGVDDLNRYRVSETDMHPNERGHQVIADAMHQAIMRDPELRALFIGSGATQWDPSQSPGARPQQR
jgi:lysophospholipase L1-like esterase